MESLVDSLPQSGVLALSVALTLYTIYRRWTQISIADIPGPEPESFLLGNLRETLQGQAGEAIQVDFKWQARFGDVVRVKGVLGTNRLMISDPKALQHIYNSGYSIRKSDFRSEITRLLTGPGLAWANDETHKRQRRVNSPAFGANEARSYIPIFAAYASLSANWKENLGGNGSVVVNTPTYFSRFFLDVIGEVAFDYQFGATNDENDALAKALSSIVSPTMSIPSKTGIFIFGLLELLPMGPMRFLMRHAPVPALQNSRRVTRIAVGVAKELVDEKAQALMAGKGKRDIMSLLVKANASENPRTNLSEVEMFAQMQTIMQAGHETTANTMSWTLFALTQHPDIQAKLRAEIMETERAMRVRGDTEYTYADFEAMQYTIALMKETFRFYPVAFNSMRQAARDEVLPLSKPIVTKSGKTLTELPIPKNTLLIISNCGYNRNPDVFGKDAHLFNPERWLDGSVQITTNVGVYGNLMTFGSGHRACIGWRFAVYEYQAFLIELVKNFEFSLDPSLASRVRRQSAVVMIPTLEGEVSKGPQLPITIKAVDAF
ncbi:cytochrome P450 [Mycena maculata]|uniref:Cytochrome P450 n=1 Tax=Mycena maculata TaxID=230809 RepID=A0AAD7IGV5_9AGAR|nr:cytochrome P450 [Mycena maculata]